MAKNLITQRAPNPTYTSSATAGHEAVLANYEEIDLHRDQIPSNGTKCPRGTTSNDKNNSSDLLFDATPTLFKGSNSSNPSTIEATGSGIAGRTTAKPSGRVVRKNGEQPSLTLVLDTADQGKSVSRWARHVELPTFSTDTFSIPVDQLIPGTTYYYAFYGTNRGGVSWTSTANSFTTRANQPPTANPDTYTAVSGVHTVPKIMEYWATIVTMNRFSLHVFLPNQQTATSHSKRRLLQLPATCTKGTDTFTYNFDPWDDAVSPESLISRGVWKKRRSCLSKPWLVHYWIWRQRMEARSRWTRIWDNDEKTNLSFGSDS